MNTDEIRPYGRRSPRTYVSIAIMLHRRLASIAWLVSRGVSHVHTGTAARVLGVSKSRIAALIAQGKLRVVDGMPGGSPKDRYVAVAELAAAPTPMQAGRARGWHLEHRNGRGDVPTATHDDKNAETPKKV